MIGRRGFLGIIAAAITGATVDPERLLWVPGKKLISIPKPVVVSRTALDIINTALRMSGVAPNRILSKADTEFSLAALNRMLDSWNCEDMPAILGPPGSFINTAIAYNLAAGLGAVYGRSAWPNPLVHQMARDSKAILRRADDLVLSK